MGVTSVFRGRRTIGSGFSAGPAANRLAEWLSVQLVNRLMQVLQRLLATPMSVRMRRR